MVAEVMRPIQAGARDSEGDVAAARSGEADAEAGDAEISAEAGAGEDQAEWADVFGFNPSPSHGYEPF